VLRDLTVVQSFVGADQQTLQHALDGKGRPGARLVLHGSAVRHDLRLADAMSHAFLR
jgi:hypothetical protein